MTYDKNNSSIPDVAAPDEPACPDVQALFGDRFRIGHDEAYHADYGSNAWRHDPWLLTIECQHGHIYPHNVDTLAASTNGRGSIANALAALDCTTVVQDGDDGTNAAFHIRDFEIVAALMKPRRKRRLSPERRAKLLEAGEKHQFKPQDTGAHGPQTALESPRRPKQLQTPTQPNPVV